MLVFFYVVYVFGYVLMNLFKVLVVIFDSDGNEVIICNEGLIWFFGVFVVLIGGVIFLLFVNVIGSQIIVVDSFLDCGEVVFLWIIVFDECKVLMIDLYGQLVWDEVVV